MKTLDQHLADQSPVMLRAIAQNQGLLVEAGNRGEFLKSLVSQMLNPAHVSDVWQDLPAPVQAAIQTLIAENNRIPATVFQRRYGTIRRFGTGALQKEKPWLAPENIAERLWYLGIITRAFDEIPDGLAEFICIPTDLLPLIPIESAEQPGFVLEDAGVIACTSGPVQDEHERFLDDLATLLIHVQNERVWLDYKGQWREKDLRVVLPQLMTAPPNPERPLMPGSRLSLLFHTAEGLDFFRVKGRQQRLNAEVVTRWLELDRFEQAMALFSAWRDSAEWNDLCLTPGLHCEEGNWRNDPLIARQALLQLLGQCQQDRWYELDKLIAAIHQQRPDFQRPDGNYDTWYIRNAAGDYVGGFEHWLEVEGDLIRYVWTGPLFWLGVVALEGSGRRWCLTRFGAACLNPSPGPPPDQPTPPSVVVTEDYHVIIPSGARLSDRFRIARFCMWEASRPGFRYRITQRGLRKAAATGITPTMVLNFLQKASDDQVPANVQEALLKFVP